MTAGAYHICPRAMPGLDCEQDVSSSQGHVERQTKTDHTGFCLFCLVK